MFWKKGKPSSKTVSSPSVDLTEGSSDILESHGVTLDRPFGMEKEGSVSSSSTSIEYHLTIQLTNNSLSRKELSLLLDVLNYQAVHFGVNLNMQLAIYELYFRLLGNKREAKEIRENHIRLTLTVSELILRILRKSDTSLGSNGVLLIADRFKELLEKGLMTKRTYGSRYRTWRPENFLKVRIVPVDIQFLKRRTDSEPYSSYCKGYGESHPSAHRQSLKPSAEYNGSGTDPLADEEQKLFERCTDPVHLLSEYLLIKFSIVEKEEK